MRAVLAALSYWGFHTGEGAVAHITLGIGAPLLTAVMWGLLLAPTSKRRLQDPALTALKLVIFGTAVLALAAAGRPAIATLFMALVVLNLALIYLWKQDSARS